MPGAGCVLEGGDLTSSRTSNLNDSCRGGLALIGHNNQDDPAALWSWELPYPCYVVNFSVHFCRCQAAKAAPGWFVCSLPRQDPTCLLMLKVDLQIHLSGRIWLFRELYKSSENSRVEILHFPQT